MANMHELYITFTQNPLILRINAIIIVFNKTSYFYLNGGIDYGKERPGLGKYRIFLYADGQAICCKL
ncbi:hypothetical protein CBFG_04810 [Clostridiales bacterium 1_7_47FAA]|nr:hypothetical protein CBFG_04810 [Clostridiales bacterium 1_7_47FAA]